MLYILSQGGQLEGKFEVSEVILKYSFLVPLSLKQEVGT